MHSIPLIKPYITAKVKKAVCDVLDSGHLTEGTVTRAFENEVAKYLDVSHAIAVTSCTTGLEVALRAFSVGPGDEVILPDYTYPATADVVAMLGATPVIVDVVPSTMLMDRLATEMAITPKTKVIMPVSLFGNPLDYSWLNALKEQYNLAIIEDSACSLGARWKGRAVGGLADISVFSMHPRKFITTGEGGMITTNNRLLAEWMNSYKHFGMETLDADRNKTHFARIGTNYKLSDVLSAIGLAQMQDIDLLLTERRAQAELYNRLLASDDRMRLPETTPEGEHSWQTYCVFVDNRDRIMQGLRAMGIEVQIGTYAIHMHPAFAEYRRVNASREMQLTGSVEVFRKALALPLYHGLTESEQNYVVEKLRAEI